MSCQHKYKNSKSICKSPPLKDGFCTLHYKQKEKESTLKKFNEDNNITGDYIKIKEYNNQLVDNKFKFDNNEFKFERDDKNIIWFEGKEFVTFMGYKDHKDAIKNHIKDKYKKTMYDLQGGGDSPPPLNENQKKTIYISEYGIFQLLTTSKLNNPMIEKFQDGLFEEILASIKKTDYQSDQLVTNLNNTQRTFKYNNNEIILIFINDNDFYVKAKEITDGLEYKNTDQAVRHHVSDEDKKTLEEILKLNPLLNRGFEKLQGNEKNSIYINEAGLYDLIMSSKKEEAKAFKKFVTHTILPSIRKTGNYISNPSNVALSDELIVKPNEITYFYDENDITPFLNLNVIYMGETGEIIIKNGKEYMVFKLGKSYRAIDRDFKEHKKSFTNFRMILILHCDNNDVVEDYLKIELKAKNMLCELQKKQKKNDNEIEDNKKQIYSETFILTDKFDLNYVMDLMKKLVDDHPLKSIKERDDKIKELEDNNKLREKELDLKIKEEETKQIEYETKKIQKQEETKQKQMDIELEKMKIELEKLKIELEIKKITHNISDKNTLLNENKFSNETLDNPDIVPSNNSNEEINNDIDNNEQNENDESDNDESNNNTSNKNVSNKKIKSCDSDEEIILKEKILNNNIKELKLLLSNPLFNNENIHQLLTDDIFNEDKWFEMFIKFVLFLFVLKRKPQTNISIAEKEVQLYRWYKSQCINYINKTGLLQLDQLKMNKWKELINNEIFKCYNMKDKIWYSTLDKLKEHIRINKKLPSMVSKNNEIKSLGIWMRNQKKRIDGIKCYDKKLAWEQFYNDHSTYFIQLEDEWYQMFNLLITYHTNYKKVTKYAKDEVTRHLAHWVQTQMVNYRDERSLMADDDKRKMWKDMCDKYNFRDL